MSNPDPAASSSSSLPARRTIANWFHYAVRNGAQTPQAVCSGVWQTIQRRLDWQTIQRRLEWSTTPESRGFLLHGLEVLRSTQPEALAYAAYVLEYEALPYEARQRVKAERAMGFLRQAMVGKEVTPAQRSYLQALGYRGAAPADRQAASQLIDQLRTQQGGRS